MSRPTLPSGTALRLLTPADAGALAAAYRDHRAHLAPWEPLRTEDFFTPAGQAEQIAARLADLAAGTEIPWVLVAEDGIIGTMTLTGIVRGPFLSAHVGYWVDTRLQNRGIGSTALHLALLHAQEELGLHRVQASVLPHNTPSRAVLQRAGFTMIGMAPSYLRIAGRWQDHLLYQRLLS
ncbi:GNAT family N-acetyltransferase [Arthrobacter agilis]|uniref:GNAT family N-acetyltransferase n=1 Tax=Arthrobacter agilis TaxID=37921 RepID=UPI000B351F03|nr:GNAT family protein [Arthrobacter agilis]OUM42948.1 GNAT family N-acetyltransferase [Arthrobacter agilis]PPB45894.1 N-acetyltransferase [Arthrobacter agilis]TPV25436.1 GNAT family N-acetyltransferase [Arthrobacter agilis]VDR33175.1 Putative ribosomal N-acetyltransferase YdaF [Arthrobacter agilis]